MSTKKNDLLSNNDLHAPDLSKRPQWLIEREDRVEKGVEDILIAMEQIHQSRRWKTELGYAKWDDYCRARWGRSADRIWQKLAWHRAWVNEIKPLLEPTMVGSEPPERAGREYVKMSEADRAVARQSIAKEAATAGRLDSKVIKSAVQKSARLAPSRNKGKDSLSKYLIRSEEQQASDIWLNFRRYTLKNVSSPRVRKLVIRLMIEQLTALEEDEKTS